MSVDTTAQRRRLSRGIWGLILRGLEVRTLAVLGVEVIIKVIIVPLEFVEAFVGQREPNPSGQIVRIAFADGFVVVALGQLFAVLCEERRQPESTRREQL